MPDWQTLAVLACLVVAGHVLSRRLLKLGNKTETSGCGSCRANHHDSKSKPLVPLDLPDRNESAPK